MTKEEIKQLEQLLLKFGQFHQGAICICYPVIQDGYNVATYDEKSGEIGESFTGPTLESVYNHFNHFNP